MSIPFIYGQYKKKRLQGGSHCIVFLNLLAVTDFLTAESCHVEMYRPLVNPALTFPRVNSSNSWECLCLHSSQMLYIFLLGIEKRP